MSSLWRAGGSRWRCFSGSQYRTCQPPRRSFGGTDRGGPGAYRRSTVARHPPDRRSSLRARRRGRESVRSGFLRGHRRRCCLSRNRFLGAGHVSLFVPNPRITNGSMGLDRREVFVFLCRVPVSLGGRCHACAPLRGADTIPAIIEHAVSTSGQVVAKNHRTTRFLHHCYDQM